MVVWLSRKVAVEVIILERGEAFADPTGVYHPICWDFPQRRGGGFVSTPAANNSKQKRKDKGMMQRYVFSQRDAGGQWCCEVVVCLQPITLATKWGVCTPGRLLEGS